MYLVRCQPYVFKVSPGNENEKNSPLPAARFIRRAECRRDSRQAHQQDLRAELQGVSHRERPAEHLRR